MPLGQSGTGGVPVVRRPFVKLPPLPKAQGAELSLLERTLREKGPGPALWQLRLEEAESRHSSAIIRQWSIGLRELKKLENADRKEIEAEEATFERVDKSFRERLGLPEKSRNSFSSDGDVDFCALPNLGRLPNDITRMSIRELSRLVAFGSVENKDEANEGVSLPVIGKMTTSFTR